MKKGRQIPRWNREYQVFLRRLAVMRPIIRPTTPSPSINRFDGSGTRLLSLDDPPAGLDWPVDAFSVPGVLRDAQLELPAPEWLNPLTAP
jgi:hypothetical protein